MANVAILIPTYNERDNIIILLDKIFKTSFDETHNLHIIIIDDNSTDGTSKVVNNIAKVNDHVHLLSRPGKLGLGSAYIYGFKWCMDNLHPDVFVQMDADLSHSPNYLRELIETVTKGVDVVLGSRYIKGGRSVLWSLHRKMISGGANCIVRLILNIKIKDATSGYRALSRNAINALLNFNVSSKGYSYQIETLHLYSLLGLSIKEVPITFFERKKGMTKLSISDMLDFLFQVIFMRLKSHRIKKHYTIRKSKTKTVKF